jgi:hypothetical protein
MIDALLERSREDSSVSVAVSTSENVTTREELILYSKALVKRNTQLTMEGIDVTPSTLKDCLGVDNTSDLQDHFVVGFDDERYQKNKEGFITGKVICLYIVDKNGQKREISPKTFRPKQGQTAPTANTVSWSEDMQKCFDSKR